MIFIIKYPFESGEVRSRINAVRVGDQLTGKDALWKIVWSVHG